MTRERLHRGDAVKVPWGKLRGRVVVLQHFIRSDFMGGWEVWLVKGPRKRDRRVEVFVRAKDRVHAGPGEAGT